MLNQLRFLQVAIFGSGLILSSSWLSAQEMPNESKYCRMIM
jgi:hypothetical protein